MKLLILSIFFTLNCPSFLTQANAVELSDHYINFTVINGLKWSEVLDKKYSNSDLKPRNFPDINGMVQKSAATEACKALGDGWHLPTMEEAITIGNKCMKLPREQLDRDFWTSTVGREDKKTGYTFSCGEYSFDFTVRAVYQPYDRSDEMSVMCVSPFNANEKLN